MAVTGRKSRLTANRLLSGATKEEEEMSIEETTAEATSGRMAAGHDARKRRQILEGARQLFLSEGFDAASMGDIALAAGVSKGTLYVYFDSKERLFQALVREEKERQFPAIFTFDADDRDVRGTLTRVGQQFARFITSRHIVMAMRAVVAMAERMPHMGSEFYDSGPRLCIGRVAQYFEAQVAAGTLAIDDVQLAASQFLDLTQSTLTRPLMFGAQEPPSEERIDAVVKSAVDMFLATYGRPAELT